MTSSKAQINPWPNILTGGRLASAPIIAGLILLNQWLAAAIVFALAALTDALDGWLARKSGAISPLGAALDHAADKALAAATLIALIARLSAPDEVFLGLIIPALIIILRDLAVAGLREGLAEIGRAPKVSRFGKFKTAFELTGLGFILAGAAAETHLPSAPFAPYNQQVAMIGLMFLWVAAALALLTFAQYLHAAVEKRRPQ